MNHYNINNWASIHMLPILLISHNEFVCMLYIGLNWYAHSAVVHLMVMLNVENYEVVRLWCAWFEKKPTKERVGTSVVVKAAQRKEGHEKKYPTTHTKRRWRGPPPWNNECIYFFLVLCIFFNWERYRIAAWHMLRKVGTISDTFFNGCFYWCSRQFYTFSMGRLNACGSNGCTETTDTNEGLWHHQILCSANAISQLLHRIEICKVCRRIDGW